MTKSDGESRSESIFPHQIRLALVASIVTMIGAGLWLNESTGRFAIPLVIGVAGSLLGMVSAYLLIRVRNRLSPPSVFISYAKDDSSFAFKLAESLHQMGVKVIFDKVDLMVGDNISEKMREFIRDADFICYIVSKSPRTSDWEQSALVEAMEMNKKVLPILIDDVELPPELSELLPAKFKPDYDYGIRALKEVLKP